MNSEEFQIDYAVALGFAKDSPPAIKIVTPDGDVFEVYAVRFSSRDGVIRIFGEDNKD